LAILLLTIPLSAAEPTIDFRRDIQPLLAEKCFPCHGPLKQESGLRLDARQAMVDQGGVVQPGDAESSLMILRVIADDDSAMPPPEQGARLTSDEIDLLRRWIDAGAAAPEKPEISGPADHWAFQVVQRKPTTPTSIDAYFANRHAEMLVTPQPPAPRTILLRRLYLDLIGIPPTIDQLQDPRDWEKIVASLLADPRHGERWGRHWMDIWRYSDWYGLGEQLRNSQKHLWHWRDWIVEAVNADKGYDAMIMEMLAGDEIAPNDPDVVRATGFLARNYYLFNRTTWLDSTVEHTGKAFLGLTFNCAKCHDHKYDPISHIDYYRFRAVFEPHQIRLDPVPGTTDLEQDGLPRAFDDHLDHPTYLHRRGNEAEPDLANPLTPGVPEILGNLDEINPIGLPPWAFAPVTRSYVRSDRIREAENQLSSADNDQRRAAAEAKLESLRATFDVEMMLHADANGCSDNELSVAGDATTDQDLLGQAKRRAAVLQATAQLRQAELNRSLAGEDAEKVKAADAEIEAAQKRLQQAELGEVEWSATRVTMKALETPEHTQETYATTYPRNSSGRRTALAQWMVDRSNPLTARVAVNHVWLRHFGEPLVPDVFDFGMRSPRPEHVDLLDFLALELIDSRWSLKHLHRLIVTSDVYRLSSSSVGADSETIARDPQNTMYWRMPRKRMESQVVRDSLLAMAGRLNQQQGGPSLDPDSDNGRRGLYLKHSRDQQDRLLSLFDDADILQCYRRSESIVPQQALALANSRLALTVSQQISERLSRDAGIETREDFIAAAFLITIARPPTDEETQACLDFTESLQRLPDVGQAADEALIRTRLLHALINHNDFISIR
jgi:hypothetical protein